MWHDPARNLLIYETPKAPDVVRIVPGAKHLYNDHVAAPISLHNLQLLRYLGLPVIPPMRDYDWPIMRPWRPRAHQVVMANFMALHPRCFNLSDMGTMKTLAALWAADFLMQQSPPGTFRCLIVATLSTLQRVWADAIFENFLGRRTCAILHGSADKRRELLAKPHDFYIINYDGLGVGAPSDARHPARGLHKDLLERTDIRLALVDECSAYKDSTTKRHRVARQVLMPRDYLWMMSGTPTPNGPIDAYGLAKLVNGAWGETLTHYKARIMYRITQFKWLPKAGAQIEARKLLSPAIRYAIEDCIDLPPCTTQKRDVEFSAEQTKAYKTLQKDLRLQVTGGATITAVNEAVLRWKLIQIACGAVYGPDHEVHKVDAAPRLAALREVLEECHEKVIIFAPLTSVVNLINKELKEFTREVINGEVPHKARSQIFRAFQEDENPRILIADPGTMAHGLTLTAASTIVWYCPIDKTEIYLQANKRIDRPGQTKSTTIVQLASTATEREIFRRLEHNETMQGVILKMVREER
jgi:SNF2 family DNA or RNA helicase